MNCIPRMLDPTGKSQVDHDLLRLLVTVPIHAVDIEPVRCRTGAEPDGSCHSVPGDLDDRRRDVPGDMDRRVGCGVADAVVVVVILEDDALFPLRAAKYSSSPMAIGRHSVSVS